MVGREKTQPCPVCGGVMRYETQDEVLTYKEHDETIETLGWWCTKCGEGILSGEGLLAHERAFLALKAEVDRVLSPAQVAAVREKLGLSQRKASELLGGGPRSFQKYEAGTQAVSTPMSNLLTLLDNEPSRLEELRAARAKASSKSDKRRGAVARKKVARKKAARKKAARKEVARKKAARKKVARKKAARKEVARKKRATKAASRKSTTSKRRASG